MTLPTKTTTKLYKALSEYEVNKVTATEQELSYLGAVYGLEVIKVMLDTAKSATITKEPIKVLKETCKTIEKQLKAMAKDDNVKFQYADKVAYSVVQGVNQANHVYLISGETKYDDDLYEIFQEYIRKTANVYILAERINKANEARKAFSPTMGNK